MEAYQKHHQTLPNESLVRLAYFEKGKVNRAARKSAKEILGQRNITSTELKEIKEVIQTWIDVAQAYHNTLHCYS